MANTLVNLARVQSTTLGTGTLTLGSAIAGFNTFADAGLTNGQTVTYAIEDYSADNPATVVGREIGVGTFSTAGPTIARTTVYSSTSAGAKINCTGRQHVFITVAAEDLASFATDLTAHLNGTSDAHDASAISFSATGGIASTDVQAAIAELDSEKLSTSAAASAYQPLDSDLTTLAANITTFGHSLVDDADNTAARTTLGLGTAAVKNTGTSGANVPLMNGANTWSATQTISGSSAFFTALQATSTSADANAGPYAILSRIGGSPAASDTLGTFLWQGQDSALTTRNYAFLACVLLDPTAASDDSEFRISTVVAGSTAARFTIGGGLVVGSPTGGDKGGGTMNVTVIYENGTSLALKYGLIASANTFTAAQTVSVDSAATNTVTTVATLRSTSTGTPAAGIGVALDFAAETAAGNNEIGARIGAVTTDVTSTSEDFDIVLSAMAAGAAVAEVGRHKSTGTYKMPVFTVANLPAGTAGEISFASNGRKNGEGAAAGTGVLVFHDGTAWRACDTGATVAA